MAYILLKGKRFEWDPSKALSNKAKHGVSFEDASELFSRSVDCLEIHDEEHSTHEDRFIAVGPIRIGIVVVVFTEQDEDVIRLLSARKATTKEKRLYESYSRGEYG